MSMYVQGNPKSKAELKRWIAAGKQLGYYQPGPFGGNEAQNGTVYAEGPHYPKPHRWYGTLQVKDGVIISCK